MDAGRLEDTSAPEEHVVAAALRLSVAAGGASAVLAVAWGLASGSRVILFDGISASLGLLMSALSLAAARAARADETPAFPYGRQTLLPTVIGAQGLARLGFTGYAVTDAVLVIRDGGDDVAAGSAIVYAALATALCLAVSIRLRGPARQDELVAAEALGWRIATFLSAAILSGFALVAMLPPGPTQEAALRYADPVLVLVVSVIVLPAPIRLIRTMARELLSMRPPPEIEEPARRAVVEVCAEMGLPEPRIRMTKSGGRLYVELDHVVAPGEWDVSRIDVLRVALRERLQSARGITPGSTSSCRATPPGSCREPPVGEGSRTAVSDRRDVPAGRHPSTGWRRRACGRPSSWWPGAACWATGGVGAPGRRRSPTGTGVGADRCRCRQSLDLELLCGSPRHDVESSAHPRQRQLEHLGLGGVGTVGGPGVSSCALLADPGGALPTVELDVLGPGAAHARVQLDERVLVELVHAMRLGLADEVGLGVGQEARYLDHR